MKKSITLIISIYLFVMCLIYSGIFRDYSNPLDVTKYYFECLKNREGFLTYQISMKDYFNDDRLGELYKIYELGNLRKLHFELKETQGNNALVLAEIILKNNNKTEALVKLQKDNNIWKIRELKKL